jgi:hypothetical protein
MKHRRTIFVASLALLLVLAGHSWANPYTAGSSVYERSGDRARTFYDGSGTVISVVQPARNTRVKTELGATIVETAILIPDSATISSVDVYADAALTTNLVVCGTNLTGALSSGGGAAAAAEAIQPAPTGFSWLGFVTPGLCALEDDGVERVTDYYLVYTFSVYPTKAAVGLHSGVLYTTDDSASLPVDLMKHFVTYPSMPAISEWGLVILGLVALAVSGLTVYRRGLTSSRIE